MELCIETGLIGGLQLPFDQAVMKCFHRSVSAVDDAAAEKIMVVITVGL